MSHAPHAADPLFFQHDRHSLRKKQQDYFITGPFDSCTFITENHLTEKTYFERQKSGVHHSSRRAPQNTAKRASHVNTNRHDPSPKRLTKRETRKLSKMSLVLHRLLQSSSSNNTNDPDVFEFLGFVAWYLFLVVCCIVPTACAYRRRRMQDFQRRNHMQQQGQQVYFSNAFNFSQQQVQERQERVNVKEIQDELAKTSMVGFM